MDEISAARIEGISDPGPGSQGQPYKTARAKAAAAGKPAPPNTPEIGAAEEEEKCKLDEMA